MPNGLLRLLSREWAGLAIAAALAAIAFAVWFGVEGPFRWVAAALLAAGTALAMGAITHLLRLARIRRNYPPPGKMVDIGGYRVHIFAEGAAIERRAIVWLGGGHTAGLTMHHLHTRLRADTRSILIDRPGTGWSDTGPFPRTTAREADEIVRALNKAGERGPFVFAGYSWGGLLAANIARRHPELVAKLVLIDPTPLEFIVFGPRFGSLKDMRTDALKSGIMRLAGIPADFSARRFRRNPDNAAGRALYEMELGSVLDTLRAIESGAGAQLAAYSIYRELSPLGAAACGWETIVYDGDLGDVPVLLLAPISAVEVEALPDVASATAAEAQRMQRFFAMARERALATSTRSRRIYTPEGTSHNLVYEAPDFVADVVREAIRG